MVDLNQLLYHHQRALIEYSGNATQAPLVETGNGSRFDLIGHYARRISRLRRQMGVPLYPEWV